jgi:hypothetical protein
VRISLERIFKAKDESVVEGEFISETTFWCEYDDHFTVLSNERSIVGVEYKYGGKNNVILKEDILNDNPHYGPQVFAILNLHNVYTILADEKTGALLAGDSIGNLVQYDLEDGHELKYYIFLGIGSITSVKLLGKVAVFGGQYNCTFIDLERRECITQKSLKTAVEGIYSVELITFVNRFNENKVYLTACGGKPDYTQKKTDIFDVTDVFELRDPRFSGKEHARKQNALLAQESVYTCPKCNTVKTESIFNLDSERFEALILQEQQKNYELAKQNSKLHVEINEKDEEIMQSKRKFENQLKDTQRMHSEIQNLNKSKADLKKELKKTNQLMSTLKSDNQMMNHKLSLTSSLDFEKPAMRE